MKVSIVLPTYNERENIGVLIELILKHVPRVHEIIVVDDNSPDKTWEFVEGLVKDNKKIRVIRRFKDKGLAQSSMEGINRAKGDVVVWMDTDLSMHPKYIPDLLKEIGRYDVVKGSRYVKGAQDLRGLSRKLPSILMCNYINFILGFGIKDPNNQFFAAKKKVFDRVRIRPLGHGQYIMAFLYDCYKQHFKIKEVPYIYRERTKGESKVSDIRTFLGFAVKYGLQPIKLRLGR